MYKVNQRYEMKLTLVEVREDSTDKVVIFKDEAGIGLVWWTNKNTKTLNNLEEVGTYKFTVKDISKRQSTKSPPTLIERVSIKKGGQN